MAEKHGSAWSVYLLPQADGQACLPGIDAMRFRLSVNSIPSSFSYYLPGESKLSDKAMSGCKMQSELGEGRCTWEINSKLPEEGSAKSSWGRLVD